MAKKSHHNPLRECASALVAMSRANRKLERLARNAMVVIGKHQSALHEGAAVEFRAEACKLVAEICSGRGSVLDYAEVILEILKTDQPPTVNNESRAVH